ncbi:YjbF family lipoprotein [Vibrio alfacsensis]|uniref:YjbF family lipoprotein n=1 Tax=Vibrio alfacsensis TaxID=1074311 RepID=UPI00406852B5
MKLGMIPAVAFVILLSGCSQRFESVNDTVKEAFFGFDDVNMTTEQIEQLPYASAYFRINDGPQIFMVLAFAEKNPENNQVQLKWLSSDKAMIVTEQGRIVKTLNLPESNLAERTNLDGPWQQTSESRSRYDWPKSNYGFNAVSDFSPQGKETVQTPTWTKELTVWEESVSFAALNDRIKNTYWVDANNDVLKSIQYLGPNMTRIEFSILKPYTE